MEKLKETAKDYIEKYPERLNQFLKEKEGEESDYRQREFVYFESNLYDLENSEASNDGYTLSGSENFSMAYNLGFEIDFDELMDSLKAKIKFLKTLPPQQTETKKKATEIKNSLNKNFSHKQINIAYCIMGITISAENSAKILSLHSQTKSIIKFLSKRQFKTTEFTQLSENQTTDTKHLQDLKAAKRLISGMKKQTKNKNAITDIKRIITAFETSFNNKY